MSNPTPAPTRFKIICRLQNGSYTEELRCGDMIRTAPFSPEEENGDIS